MKKVLVLLICLLLVGCEANVNKTNNEEIDKTKEEINDKNNEEINNNDITKFKEEYEALNDKSVKMEVNENAKLHYLDIDGAIDFLKNKTGILYFGFPTCPWCRNILPVLFNVSIDNNEEIYYFNPKELRETNDEKFNKIMEILDKYLKSNSNGEKTLYVPDVYFVKDGNIKGHHLSSVESQTNPYETLNDSQKQELYNIYNNLLSEIK